MGGPAACVLVPSPVTARDVLRVIEREFPVEPGSPHPFDHSHVFDGWIGGRPFFVSRGFDYPEFLDDLDVAAIRSQWGWAPADEIGTAAMCNGEEDHLLLGRLCVAFANKFGGIIDLCGRPWSMPEDVSDFPGVIVGLQVYDSGKAKPGSSHCVCDATFLAHWIKQPGFTMVK